MSEEFTVRVAQRIYKLALHLYPRSFRQRFGDALEDTFAQSARNRLVSRGRISLALFLLRCLLDIVPDSLAARRGVTVTPSAKNGRRHFATGVGQDLAVAARGLRRQPGSAFVAVGTLAIGVGVTASLFAVLYAVLLRPLPYFESDRLAVVQDRSLEGGAPFRTTGGAYIDWSESTETMGAMALVGGTAFTFTEADLGPQRVDGSRITEGYFDLLGLRPALGRGFRAEEMRGGHRVLILSDALWRNRYGADPAILDRPVLVDGEPWRVIGVLPAVSFLSSTNDLTLHSSDTPWAFTPVDFSEGWVAEHRSHVFTALGRLAPDTTFDGAASEFETLTQGIRERHPEYYQRLAASVRPLDEVLFSSARTDLWLLFSAGLVVLAVTCTNLANLLLARSVYRRPERLVRAALGADTSQLLRFGLFEALWIGALGAIFGSLLAFLAVRSLSPLLPVDLPRASELSANPVMLGFAALVALLSALIAGAVPAFRGARRFDLSMLSGAGRRTGGRSERRHVAGLVVVQLGMACVLLVGAGLLFRSFLELRNADLGVDTSNTVLGDLLLPQERYADRSATVATVLAIQERVAAVPGVESVALAYDPPLDANWTESFTVLGRPPLPPGEILGAHFRPVTPNYFEQHGIRLQRGRLFDQTDGPSAPGVIVVNERFVADHFPNEDPLGQRVRMTTPNANWGDGPKEWEIVGVVADVRFLGARREPSDAFYFSMLQAPTSYLHILARTETEPLNVVPDIRTALGTIDQQVPWTSVTTLEQLHASHNAQDQLNALLSLVFAIVALVVAGAGVYAVLSDAVAHRIPEMGLRLALGARPAAVRRQLLGNTLALAGLGLIAGGLGSIFVGKTLSGLLYGVPPWDPVVLVGVVVLLLGVALLAGLGPALRAARTSPTVALRGD